MSMASLPTLGENGTLIERHWRELAARRRVYTALGLAIFAMALTSSLWFANDSNSRKFFDRLPYLFDFMGE